MFFSKKIYRVIGIALLAMLSFIFASLIHAQQTQTTTIQLVGVIEEIDENIIVISGVQVDVSTSNVLVTDLQLGMTISVSGTLQNGVVMATTIVIIAEPSETPVPDPESTAEVTPDPEATTEVTPAPTITVPISGEPIIVIEGPVQEININYITIFDIDIQVDSADPVLTQIRLGDTIRIEGATQLNGNTIIIVAINITIIQVQSIIIINPGAPAIGGLPANCRMNRTGRITCRSRRTSRRS